MKNNEIENYWDSNFAHDVRCKDLLNLESVQGSLGNILKTMEEVWGNNMRVGTVYVYKDETGRMHIHFSERGSYLEKFLPKDIPTMNMDVLDK